MLKNTKLNLKSNRHSELVSESNRYGSQNKFGMTQGETGRSMVEMLGVLAIIGVLSVAGIAGYIMGMRSYRANEVVNAASMLYVMAKAQNAGNGATANVTYASLNNGTNPSGVASLTYTNGSITIAFNTKEDCDAAKLKLGDKAGTCPATATNNVYALTVTLGESGASTCPEGKYKIGDAGTQIQVCQDGEWIGYESSYGQRLTCMSVTNHGPADTPNELCGGYPPEEI